MGLKFETRDLPIAAVTFNGTISISFNESISCEPNFLDVNEVEKLNIGDEKYTDFLLFKGTLPESIPEKYAPKLRIKYSRTKDLEYGSQYHITYIVTLKREDVPDYYSYTLNWTYILDDGVKKFAVNNMTPCFAIDRENKLANGLNFAAAHGALNGFVGEKDGAWWSSINGLLINPTSLLGTMHNGSYVDNVYYPGNADLEPVPEKGTDIKFFFDGTLSNEYTWWYQLLDANTTSSSYSCGYLEPREYEIPKQPILADGCSDKISLSNISNFSIFQSGFLTAWHMTLIELRNLALKLFSPSIIDIIKQLGITPFDNIVSLQLFFGELIDAEKGNIHLSFYDTEIESTRIKQQFTEFDCGSISLKTYYNAFMDYSPYTKISIYLPFIGYKQLDTDDVMNAEINIKYRFNVLTGECVAFIIVKKTINTTELDSVLYSFAGNASIHMPFTAQNSTNFLTGLIKTGLSGGNYIANAFSPTETTSNDIWSKEQGQNKQKTNFSSYLSKVQVNRGGSEFGFTSATGVMTPYIIMERPIMSNPVNYEDFFGGVCWSTHIASELSGFTKFYAINLSIPSATEQEVLAIDKALKEGVIF